MAVAAALATAACGGVSNNNSADAGTIAPTFTSIQQNIFNVSCAVSPCHTTATYTSAGYLDLSQGNAYASLLGDAGTGAPIPAAAVMNTSNDPGEGVAADGGYLLVAPGDPAKSFLLLKITPGLQPQYGLQMPNTGVTLSTDQVQAVSQWIQNGAMND
jgi:hypothetical protein